MLKDSTARLDDRRVRELFDLRGHSFEVRGGSFADDPYPAFNRLRESGPVHQGTPGELAGYTGPAFFTGLPMPDRAHFTAFDFETCDQVVKDSDTFSASPHEPGSPDYEKEKMLLFMDGKRHQRLRSLVRNAFTPRRAGWWIDNWIADTVDSLIEMIAANGKSDLNVEVFAAVPLLTICKSFGVSVEDALEIRAAIIAENGRGFAEFHRIVMPLIAARRGDPLDDLISMLVHAEVQEDDGGRHRLSDDDVLIFSFMLLAAGTGTSWKQMGITMLNLLTRPQWLRRARENPEWIAQVVEESMRWMPTDPAFARFATRDTQLGGVAIPKGAVVHVCFAAANRDPKRWDRPDEFDPARPFQPNLGFGRGAHVCLGQHVARAEMRTAIAELLARLPGLRLDENAETPRIIGMYERGPTSVPVVWDTAVTTTTPIG